MTVGICRSDALVGVVLFVLLSASAAWGSPGYVQPLQEVFQTELVYPQERGEVQLTAAPRYRSGADEDLFELPLAVEYGITDAWQVGLDWRSIVHRRPREEDSTTGAGGLEVETKYSFMNVGESDFHAALAFSLGIPLGDVDRGLTEGFLEYEPAVLLAYDFPRLANSQLFTEVRVGFVQRVRSPSDPDEAEPPSHELGWSSGFFVPVGPIRLTLELTLETNEWNNRGEEAGWSLTPGVVWDLPGRWEIGIGVPIGLSGDEEWAATGLLIYELDLFQDEDDD